MPILKKHISFFQGGLNILIAFGLSNGTCNMHLKSRVLLYPRANGEVKRLSVPDHKVEWKVAWDDYNPPEFNSPSLNKKQWADPFIGEADFDPKWNNLDGNVNRRSHIGDYEVINGVPINPQGRTGLRGRGVLGRWGPNHAADPIVSRWKRNPDKSVVINPSTNKKMLQFVGIKRRDSGDWAIPGGMVDPGENVTSTLKREFMEEALNYLDASDDSKINLNEKMDTFFSNGIEIYKGYVDDPRNTDNAWMETVAQNFHDDSGDFVGSLPFEAGDDAVNVTWIDMDQYIQLYASHSQMIALVASLREAHW